MKKLFVAATLGLALVSCGGPSVCDCAQMSKDIMKEASEAKDAAAATAIEEKYADQAKECEKLGEGKTPEELKAMMEEAQNCK
jgi:hypothetical protein